MSKNKRVETANQAIGMGALAQLSRNGKINNAGGLFIFVGLITLIGEMFKFIFKWIIIKPCIFVLKCFWVCFKYITPIVIAFIMALFQCSYKYIRKIFDNNKNETI